MDEAGVIKQTLIEVIFLTFKELSPKEGWWRRIQIKLLQNWCKEYVFKLHSINSTHSLDQVTGHSWWENTYRKEDPHVQYLQVQFLYMWHFNCIQSQLKTGRGGSRFFKYLYFTWVFIYLTTLYFSSPHLNTNIWTFSSFHFPNRLVTLVWMFLPFWLNSGRFTNQKCRYLTFWKWDSTLNSFCGAFRNSSDKSLLILPLSLKLFALY